MMKLSMVIWMLLIDAMEITLDYGSLDYITNIHLCLLMILPLIETTPKQLRLDNLDAWWGLVQQKRGYPFKLEDLPITETRHAVHTYFELWKGIHEIEVS